MLARRSLACWRSPAAATTRADRGRDRGRPSEPAQTERRRPGGGTRRGQAGRRSATSTSRVFVAQPPGTEDLYVVEKPGRVQLVRDGETSPEPFSTSATRSPTAASRACSRSPSPRTSRRLALLYAYFTDTEQDQRVVEFRVAEDGTIDAGSEREVLKMDDFASNHNGGLLLFGPDDLLYIGTGDGGHRRRPGAQRPGPRHACSARSCGSTRAAERRQPVRDPGRQPVRRARRAPAPEVYSYGLRNPWRFSFDRQTRRAGDRRRRPELARGDRLRAAGEGARRELRLVGVRGDRALQRRPGGARATSPPILTYGRDGGCSITGGYVVRDPALPAPRTGRYLYGDFCAGELRSFVPAKGGARGRPAARPRGARA